ncbi:TPA: AMP-binding protein, partial [Legionella pneumophila]
NLQNYCLWFKDTTEMNAESIVDFSTSAGFDFSITVSFLPLVVGARVVILDNISKQDVSFYLGHLKKNKINIIKLTPSYFNQILSYHPDNNVLKDLKAVILAGESHSIAPIKSWFKLYPNHRFVNSYGPTETTVAACAYALEKNFFLKETINQLPIGRPANNTKAYILDGHLQPVPIGV